VGSFSLLFFLPPLSTLFPYTTLFRSSPFGSTGFIGCSPAFGAWLGLAAPRGSGFDGGGVLAFLFGMPRSLSFGLFVSRLFCQLRSEEHTSELQSLAYLVCRLLLEKKK